MACARAADQEPWCHAHVGATSQDPLSILGRDDNGGGKTKMSRTALRTKKPEGLNGWTTVNWHSGGMIKIQYLCPRTMLLLWKHASVWRLLRGSYHLTWAQTCLSNQFRSGCLSTEIMQLNKHSEHILCWWVSQVGDRQVSMCQQGIFSVFAQLRNVLHNLLNKDTAHIDSFLNSVCVLLRMLGNLLRSGACE